MTQKWAIGVDIGGTKIAVAHVDANGKIQKLLRLHTNVKDGHKAVENDIISAAQELQKNAKSSPVGMGIGMAGQINPETGLVYFAPNLQWHNVPLQSNLSCSLNIPVTVINDVRAITWAEWKHGSGKNCSNFVCIFIGTGIGGGIVSNGQLLTGFTNTAGEIGHIVVDKNGPSCTCGGIGCMEAFAGGWGIAKHAQEAVLADPRKGKKLLDLSGGILEAITAKTVSQAVLDKNPLAIEIANEAVEALVAGTTSIVNAFNPEKIIFGGGVVHGMPWLVKEIDKGVRERALPAACKKLKIVSSKLYPNAGVIGAGTIAIASSQEKK